jgi:hypothetical protein
VNNSFRSIGLDNILNNVGTSPRQSDGKYAFWNLKEGSTTILYFLSDPWNDPANAWFDWREIYARDGFVGGIQPTGGLRGVPVDDTDGPEGDILLSLVQPYVTQKSTTPVRPVETKVGISIVEIQEGEKEIHKVLVLSAARFRKLMERVKSWQEMDDDFTLVGRRFRLTVEGKGYAEQIILSPIKGAAPIDLPEPFDIPALLEARRATIFDLIHAESGLNEVVEEKVSVDPPSVYEPQSAYATPYDGMTAARLKTLLNKAGVSFHPEADREALIKLATQEL